MTNILRNAGNDTTQLGVRNLRARRQHLYQSAESGRRGGTIDPATYTNLVTQISAAVKNATDANSRFNVSLNEGRIFTNVREPAGQLPAGSRAVHQQEDRPGLR